MRILVLSSVYPSRTTPHFGVFVRERVRRVAQHCEVRVVSPLPWFPFNALIRGAERAATPAFERDGAIEVHHPRFPSLPLVGKSLDAALYFAALVPFVARLRRSFDFDLIDAHFAYPDGVAAALLARHFRRPLVVTLRGDEQRLLAFPLRRRQMAWALRQARVICVSRSLAQVAEELGVPAGTARVIPNGIDAGVFRPIDRGAARHGLGLPSDRTILLTVGALIERKGQQRVLPLLPALVRERPDLLYVVVGGAVKGDSYAEQFAVEVRQAGLQEHVLIAPAQQHQQIPLWMAAADLFCLATRWEGWCNALTEALACGLPVVTTAVGGNPELVRAGDDGLLVPYWDGAAFGRALSEALRLPWDRDAISRRAHERGWDRVAEEVVDEFTTVLRERPHTLGTETARS